MTAALPVFLGACGGATQGLVVEVDPPQANVVMRSQQSFTAQVRGSLGRDVDWSVVQGPGTIDSAGIYTAPGLVLPSQAPDVVVRASSRVAPGHFADAHLRIVRAPIEPARGTTAGGTQIVVGGKGFLAGSTQVLFGGVAGGNVSIISPTELLVTSPAAAIPGPVDVDVVVAGAPDAHYPAAFHYGAALVNASDGYVVRRCSTTFVLPQGMIAVDVDGDGDLDVVAVCGDDDRVEVFLNDGHGSLGLPVFYATGSVTPIRIQARDLDGDGYPELVVVNFSSFEILQNDGAGGFSLSQTFALNATLGEAHIAFADANLDGFPDVLIVDQSGFLAAALNDGNGMLSPPIAFVALAPGAKGLAAGFLDADARTDLVATSTTGFSLFLASPGGGYFPRVDFAAKPAVQEIAVGDLDHDGHADVLTFSNATDNKPITFFHGNGNGTFAPGIPPALANYSGSHFSIADIDGDGALDLETSFSTPTGTLTLTLSYGPLGTVVENVAAVGAAKDSDVVAADLDGDGLAELLTAGPDSIEVRRQGAPRRFGAALVSLSNPIEVASSGGLIVATSSAPPSLSWIAAVSSSGLQTIAIPGGSTFPLTVRASDLDGDGLTDAVVGDVGSLQLDGKAWVFRGQSGGFGAPAPVSFHANVLDAVAGDFDGDGFADIAVTSSVDGATSTVRIRWGSGPLAFASSALDVSFSAGFLPRRIEAADLDGDGKPELIAADLFANQIAVVGFSGRTPRPALLFPIASAPSVVRIADLNQDGVPDLVVLAAFEESVAEVDVLLGIGGDSFGPAQQYRVSGTPHALQIADVDGDGFPDVVVATSGPSVLSVLRGAGDGSLDPEPQRLLVENSPLALTLRDVDGDGLTDLVVLDGGAGAIQILRNGSR